MLLRLLFSAHIFYLLLLGHTSRAQQSSLTASLEMPSKILNQPVKFSVYLPAGYATSGQQYPILYLLHGAGDNETSWQQKGNIQTITDKAIAAAETPAMIIVMPAAGATYYVNDKDGKVRYEDMFFREFIPFIEKQYRVKNTKADRNIAGLSMGGFGALFFAVKHPDLFNSCVALSAAVRTDDEIIALDQVGYNRRFGHISGLDLTGNNRMSAYYRQISILDLTKNIPATELKKVKFYLDCGDDDQLTVGNATLHIQLTKAGIPHEYRSRNGGHNWPYWQTGIADGLKFISGNSKN